VFQLIAVSSRRQFAAAETSRISPLALTHALIVCVALAPDAASAYVVAAAARTATSAACDPSCGRILGRRSRLA